MRGGAHERRMNKLAAAQHKAEEKWAAAKARKKREAANAEEHAEYIYFKDDPDLYVFPKLKYVGIELWQMPLHQLIQPDINCSVCSFPAFNMLL
ncbi:hypothetical protein SSX86_006627 [Deinandra increscens subsp. villosa]|uniref:Uncharacterized protein n=1 Tax=Deinandra increscens subsp. villosa TaxID=3103831 RepID=A0AAP0DJV2_9ASTR